MENEILKFENVSFGYGDTQKKIFEDLNFLAKKQDFIAILGNNGKGKSTFLKLCAGILLPHSGSIFIEKTNTNSNNSLKNFEIRKKIGYIFQNPDKQIFWLTVFEDIAFGAKNLGIKKDIYEKKTDEILDLLKITHLKNASIKELSTGEKQLVTLAACLVTEPSIILLDEPTANLDDCYSKNLFNLLDILNKKSKKTIIFSTHNERDTAFANSTFKVQDNTLKKFFYVKNQSNFHQSPINFSESVNKNAHSSHNNKVLSFENVSFYYNKSKNIIENFNFSLNFNEIFGIFGGSFCGKTTISKLIAGLLRPSKGKIINYHNSKIGLVMQQSDKNFFFKNVYDDIKFSLTYKKLSSDYIKNTINKTFNLLQLDNSFLQKNTYELSGGEKKLIAIAEILIDEPDILVLDEPLMGLDTSNKNLVKSTILELKLKKNLSTILLSNYSQELLNICDRAIELKKYLP